MNSIEIPIYIEARRLQAVRDALAADGLTVEDKLHETFNFLYEQLVPAEHRTVIEAEIQKEEADAAAALETRRRFSVIHVRENGEDAHFTSDLFRSFMPAAYRYRLYSRNELSDEHESFAAAFIETNEISRQKYESFCDRMPNDFRITALLDFDIDSGTVRYATAPITHGGHTICTMYPSPHTRRSELTTVLQMSEREYSTASSNKRKFA